MADILSVPPNASERAQNTALDPLERPIERRRRARWNVHWPVRFATGRAGSAESSTVNLSSAGFYCHTLASFAPGEVMGCIVVLPGHDFADRKHGNALECKARVMRVDREGAEGVYGVAFRILEYRFV